MRPTHFLESLDSVRAPVRLSGGRVPSISRDQLEQAAAARCEALMALAFGRDIVVPQSYALDSFACQDLVLTVSHAERTTRQRLHDVELPRPLRLHLYNTPRFVDAAVAMFAGVGDQSWTSSLYPDLSQTDEAHGLADEMSKGLAANPLEWLPDWRADMFTATWDYFRTARRGDTRRVVQARPSGGPSLEHQVRQFVARESAARDEGTPTNRTARELAKLIELSPESEPFKSRSRVHGQASWTGRIGEPSARDIVGDARLMHQVLEVVDTMYNRSVVDSIGNTLAAYSTRVGPWDEVQSEGVVQQEALQSGDSMSGGAFEIAFDKTSLDSAIEVIPSLVHAEAFAEVLKVRGNRDWVNSYERLTQATTGTDYERDRAVDHHTRLIAKALDGLVRVEGDRSGIWFEAQGLARDVMTMGTPALLAVFNPWLGLSAAAPAVGGRMWRAVQKRRGFELRHGALGKLVRPRTDHP